jgi:hypothetical protein
MENFHQGERIKTTGLSRDKVSIIMGTKYSIRICCCSETTQWLRDRRKDRENRETL